jgi:DNA-binding transcriptional regulator YiaG
MHTSVEVLMEIQKYFKIPTCRIAGLLRVSDTTVRRWRSGKTNPSPVYCDRIYTLIKAVREATQEVCEKYQNDG